jgi:16S rRNA processing protein RimM
MVQEDPLPGDDRSQKAQPAGSPSPGEPEFLVIGKLRKPHGIHGEIVMEVLTDFPERLRPGVTVYAGEARRPLRIRKVRTHQQALLVTFEDYTDPETVGELRNEYVYVRAEDRPPLPEGEYYHHQLLGMRVVTESGNFLGNLIQILDTSANDIYVIRPESGPEILLPAIEEVILDIDLERKEIQVHLLPGLLPNDSA